MRTCLFGCRGHIYPIHLSKLIADLLYWGISVTCSSHLQVKLALCQLHVTDDKDANVRTARAAVEVSVV